MTDALPTRQGGAMESLRAAGRGAVAGVVATLAMSVPMLAASRLGIVQRMGLADDIKDQDTRDALAVANHLGFGAGGGAIFGLVSRRLPRSVPRVAAGMAYGAMIWTVSYAGWVPALRLMPAPHDDEPARPALMLGAHLVYGAVLGALTPTRRSASPLPAAGGI
ncbi:MAG: hypothetical protein M3452_11420 [Chloroflexota bacterium]|nr:hypothetical protein [Chloroflexota bacterium]